MPRIHTVKKAQKDYPESGIVKGEEYYWYKQKIMSGGGWHSRLTRTKTYPTPSQLTQSEFQKSILDIQNQVAFDSAGSFADLETMKDEVREAVDGLLSEQQEKLENIPESLKEGPSGQLIQERVEMLEGVVASLESVDVPDDEDYKLGEKADKENGEEEGDYNSEYDSELESKKQELNDAIGELG